MIRYQRFTETCVTEKDFQEFYNKLSAGGWKIIYYNEHSHAQSGDKQILIHITAVCESIQNY